MADLQQIVGAILRDIAQARFSSDVYSRELSRYYEQDPLLRRFPVPRTEISEVDLDLKFTVTGMERSEDGGAGDESSTATAFTRAAYRITQRFFDALARTLREADDVRLEDDPWRGLLELVERTSPRIDCQQDVLEHLERNQGHLISDGQLDRAALGRGLRALLTEFIDRVLLPRAGMQAGEAPVLRAAVEGGDALTDELDELAAAVERALLRSGGRQVEVEVTAAYLREVPAEVISSLRIKADVQNYMWSEVGEVDGRTWRKLSPE